MSFDTFTAEVFEIVFRLLPSLHKKVTTTGTNPQNTFEGTTDEHRTTQARIG